MEKFVGLQNFKIEDFGKEEPEPIKRSYTLEDLLKLPCNDLYLENKLKQNLHINSNFKISTDILNNTNATESSR